jgi:hypothetical protein
VHFAAVVGESACSVDTEQAWSTNVDGSKTILAAARAAKTASFIYISTCSNYGVGKPGEFATEDSPLNPLSEYARAKFECERLILSEAPPPSSFLPAMLDRRQTPVAVAVYGQEIVRQRFFPERHRQAGRAIETKQSVIGMVEQRHKVLDGAALTGEPSGGDF